MINKASIMEWFDIQRWIKPIFLAIYFFLSIYSLIILGFTGGFGADWLGHKVRPAAYRPLIENLTDAVDWVTPTSVKDGIKPHLIALTQTNVVTQLVMRRNWEPVNHALSEQGIIRTSEMMLVIYANIIAFLIV